MCDPADHTSGLGRHWNCPRRSGCPATRPIRTSGHSTTQRPYRSGFRHRSAKTSGLPRRRTWMRPSNDRIQARPDAAPDQTGCRTRSTSCQRICRNRRQSRQIAAGTNPRPLGQCPETTALIDRCCWSIGHVPTKTRQRPARPLGRSRPARPNSWTSRSFARQAPRSF